MKQIAALKAQLSLSSMAANIPCLFSPPSLLRNKLITVVTDNLCAKLEIDISTATNCQREPNEFSSIILSSLPLYEDSTFSNLSYADGEKERKKRVPESVKNLARSPRPLISEISRRNAICNAIRNLWVII